MSEDFRKYKKEFLKDNFCYVTEVTQDEFNSITQEQSEYYYAEVFENKAI